MSIAVLLNEYPASSSGGVDSVEISQQLTLTDASVYEDAPDAVQEIARKAAYVNKVVRGAEQVETARAVPFEELQSRFLQTYKSVHTRTAYKSAISTWRAYCVSEGINPLLAEPMQADAFASHMCNDKSPRTANLIINAVSSFYAMLAKWRVIPSTIFIKCKRAKVQTITHRVPSEDDIKEAIAEARRRGRNHVADAIILLRATGLRVGALKTIKADRVHNVYKAESKSSEIVIKIPDDMKRMNITKWHKIETAKLQQHIRRAFKSRYSVHDIRHAFAIDLYRKSGNDIYSVMRALCHASVNTTINYLHGIGIM